MNSQVFKFASPGAQVSRRAALRLLGYPEDFDQHYMERLEAVTPEGIRLAAVNRWNLKDLRVVVVGSEKACQALVAGLPQQIAHLPLYRAGFDERLTLPKSPVASPAALCH